MTNELPENCTGDGCNVCSGEYCMRHFNDPCECDVIDRHTPRQTPASPVSDDVEREQQIEITALREELETRVRIAERQGWTNRSVPVQLLRQVAAALSPPSAPASDSRRCVWCGHEKAASVPLSRASASAQSQEDQGGYESHGGRSDLGPAAPDAASHDGSSTTESESGKDYDARLDVKLEHGALVIRIGIKTLAHACTYSDWANPYDEESGDYIRTFAIVDAVEFARDIGRAMQDEREDGSSPLSDFLDKMSQDALDGGSLGQHDEEVCIKHGETHPLETWVLAGNPATTEVSVAPAASPAQEKSSSSSDLP